MAYVPGMLGQMPDDEDQKRQQAPTLSAGLPASSQSFGGGAPAAQAPGMGQQPGRSAMQSRGSGFVNLSSFLTPATAQQNQQKAGDTAKSTSTGALNSFGTAADRARDGINAAPAPLRAGSINGLAAGAMGGDKTAFDTLSGMLGQKYAGPTGVDFDLDADENMKRLRGLGSADTALDAMHPGLKNKDGLLAPGYSQGNRWLDESLIKGDAGMQKTFDDAKTKAGGVEKFVGDTTKEIEGEAAKKAGEIEGEASSARQQLGTYLKDIVGAAQGKADAFNDRSEDEAMKARGMVRNPETGGWSFVAPGQRIAGWEDGGNATAGNFVDPKTSTGLEKLAALLGDPSLAVKSSGPVARGRYITADDPGLQANELAVKGNPNDTPGVRFDPNAGQLGVKTGDWFTDFLRAARGAR